MAQIKIEATVKQQDVQVSGRRHAPFPLPGLLFFCALVVGLVCAPKSPSAKKNTSPLPEPTGTSLPVAHTGMREIELKACTMDGQTATLDVWVKELSKENLNNDMLLQNAFKNASRNLDGKEMVGNAGARAVSDSFDKLTKQQLQEKMHPGQSLESATQSLEGTVMGTTFGIPTVGGPGCSVTTALTGGAHLEVGQKREDSTVYLGYYKGKDWFVASEDAKDVNGEALLMDFNQASGYSTSFDMYGHHDWQLPDLDILDKMKEAKHKGEFSGTYNEIDHSANSSYWSSVHGGMWAGSEFFSDPPQHSWGFEYDTGANFTAHARVRCVRSESRFSK